MALTGGEIAQMIGQPEGPLIERKPSRVNAREIRQTVVAFANTVSGADEAVLFIGVRDDGIIEGCDNTDATQKTVRDVCEKQCYPAIAFRIEILPRHRNVVAVIIPPSQNRPHFAGTAYMRRGSESVAAPDDVFDEMVYSRNSKAGAFLKMKRTSEIVRVVGTEYGRGEGKFLLVGTAQGIECKVLDCNAHYVRFEVLGNSRRISEPLENISISIDDEKWCPKIIVRA
jgi:schlafen family protein